MAATDTEPPWDNTYYMRPGYLMPSSCNTAENVKNFRVRDDDVFIITYPRSGTFWTTRVVRAILTFNPAIMDVNHTIMDELLFTLAFRPFPKFPELIKFGSAIDKYNDRLSPREIGSHLLPDLLPTQYHEKKPKTIYVQRNPKDVAVSFYFLHFAVKYFGKPKSWDNFFSEFMNGNVECGSCLEHVKQWSEYRNKPGYLWIRYEDMIKEPQKVYHKIAHFLDKPMTEAEMKVVMRFCDFKYMQELMKHHQDAQYFLEQDEKFVRQGKVGDWKNYFTVAQSEAFDKMYHEEMKCYEDLKYDF